MPTLRHRPVRALLASSCLVLAACSTDTPTAVRNDPARAARPHAARAGAASAGSAVPTSLADATGAGVTTVPAAGRSTACFGSRPWSRTSSPAGPRTVQFVESGIDGAPAARMAVYVDGRLTAQIHARWRRQDDSWTLVSRTVDLTAAPAATVAPLPTASTDDYIDAGRECSPAAAARPVSGAPSGGGVTGALSLGLDPANPGAGRIRPTSTDDPCYQYGLPSGRCESERLQYEAAARAATIAFVAMMAACSVPEPGQPIVCASAIAAWTIYENDRILKWQLFELCRRSTLEECEPAGPMSAGRGRAVWGTTIRPAPNA